MSAYASTSIPKPKNWQDFESRSCILFQCVLNDPTGITHGRGGQTQDGVDIYGRRGGSGVEWTGVQCKLKGDTEKLTEDELKREVAKAKKFRPALREYIVVTTAPDDVEIQRIARQITQQHEKDGLFSVNVWGWQTVEREITQHPPALKAFHPDATPFTDHQIALAESTFALTQENSVKIERLIGLMERSAGATVSGDAERVGKATDQLSAATETLEKHIHSEIDGYRDLLRQGQVRTAQKLLESLKGRVWDNASARVRFRIVTNLGAALLEQGEESQAATAFLEALAYDPTDQIAMANAALAYLLRNEPRQAIAAADAALQHDGTNASAAAYRISGFLTDGTVSDPLSLVPENLRDSAEALASAVNFLAHRSDDGWRVLARRAAEKYPDDKLLRRRAAEAVLDRALSSGQFETGRRLDEDITLDEIHKATSVLQALWKETKTSEARRSETALPQNLARALWALDEADAASAIMDQALERSPADPELLELRAALHFGAGEPDAALTLVGDNVGGPNLALMHAQALLKTDPQKARDILHGPSFADAPDNQKLAAEILTVETLVHEGKPEQALKSAERLVREYDTSVDPLTELARVQRLLEQDEADNTLTHAIEKLGPETRFLERFRLASALEEVGRHDDAIATIADYVDKTHDSPALRLLAFATINADRRKAAADLLSSLPPQLASQPPYLKALVAVNVNRKDFPAALDALEQYLIQRPHDLEMRLRWASICLRQNLADRVDVFLRGDVEALFGDPEERMELSHLLAHFGYSERALKLGYGVFIGQSTSPQVHLRYAGLLLNPDRTDAILLDRDFIDNNVAFEIDDGHGGKTWFIVEPDLALRKDETYIAPDHDVALRAKGLKAGDKIVWDEQGHHRQWEITTVKHKYLHALHQSMDKFERHFPTEHGLRQVSIDDNAEEPFEEVFKDIKNRHDSIQGVFDILGENLIPIHVAAKALGRNIVETRYGLQEAGKPYRVCEGTGPERANAMAAVRDNAGQGCVVDAITLTLVLRLGLMQAVESVCGPIGLTGSTRDVFWSGVQEINAGGRPSLSIFWKDGHFYRHETTQDDWERARQVREADLAWIDDHATIIAAEGITDAPAELRRINQAIEKNFIDDMLAAQGSGRLLLCQDQAYRSLAAQSLGLRTSWLQPVLMVARDQGFVTQEEYYKAVLALLEFGDQVISIDGKILMAAAREQQEKPQCFERVVGSLGGPKAEMISHIGVAADFLKIVWSEHPWELATSMQTGMVLTTLLSGREDWRSVIAILRAMYRQRFGKNDALDHYILAWLHGHFLVPFSIKTLPLADFVERTQ